MNLERWTADQRILREAVRARRRTPDGRRPVASPDGALALDAGRTDPHGAAIISERDPRDESGVVPLASVIVVCWNSAEVLGRCLDQLLAQDHANYEVIVVDDGSEDNTLEVAAERAAHRELDDRAQPGQSGLSPCTEPWPSSRKGRDCRLR